MSWDPDLYLASDGYSHRLRPALDLISRIPLKEPRRIVDLGCGAGDVTRLVAERWPDAEIVGIDNSPAMLERAKRDCPQITTELCDIACWKPREACDLLLSNASLQWLTDHETLLPRLIDTMQPGGVLAVQMPHNYAQPSHVAIPEAIAARDWGVALAPLLRTQPVGTSQFYFRLLATRSARLDIWETEYLHVLTGPDPVVQWTRPTTLRPFLDALDQPERRAFEAEYRQRVRKSYPPEADGRTLYPFRRLFLIAER